MKQILLIISMALFDVMNMWGAKANSTPMSFIQPDGTTITVRLLGDEYMSFFTSEDGVILIRRDNAFYVADFNGSELTATRVLAHNKDERNFAETTTISKQNRKEIFSYLDAKRESNIRKVSIDNRTPAYFGHSGSPKVLVVLAEYSDLPFIIDDPQKTFEQFFNAEGEDNHENFGHDENRNCMSVREYFKTCSRGLYTPEFVVTKPIKVGTMDTYGGKNENSSSDENVPQLLRDCMENLESGYNLSDFDNDGDGRVDLVYIIFSGYCQNNGGPANSVWSKTGSTNVEVNGTKLTWYSCTSELNLYEGYYTKRSIDPWVNGIGVTCHEIGHALGLPDIYPTSSSAWVDNQEMEYWDLMDGGEYVKNGYSPKDYTAWEREVMGWDTIEEITENNTTISLTPLLEGGKAYKFCNPANKEEYFVMENIQNNGLNKSFPGHGMIVYHVKYPYSSVSMGGNPNNTKGKPGMAIVPADGIVMSSYLDYTSADYRGSHKGDPFPGTSIVTKLDYLMNLPNYLWYDGEEKVENGFSSIDEDYDTGTITALYHKDIDAYYESVAGVDKVSLTSADNAPIYDLWGRKLFCTPTRGFYIHQGRKIVK